MVNINFILKEPKSKNETLVFLLLNYQNNRYKQSTSLKIKPAEWNPEKMRMREISGSDYKSVNRKLGEIEKKARNAINYFTDTGVIPSPMQLRERMGARMQTLDMQQYFTDFIDAIKNQRGKNASRYFQIAVTQLLAFNQKIQWRNMDLNGYNQFWQFLSRQNLSTNYMGSIVNRIRIMCNRARQEGVISTDDFKAWKKKQEHVYNVYLNEQEIEALYNHQATGRDRMARDLFIIGCCTGLRVGNYLKIDPGLQIDKEAGFLYAVANKNGPRVMIPIHWMVSEIIARNNGKLPSMSEQELNRRIKNVCGAAGIVNQVVWCITRGNAREINSTPKNELVTSHTARRSFATNLYLRGEPPAAIMALTGHKTVKTFMEYIKITAEESSRKLANSGFFRKDDVSVSGKQDPQTLLTPAQNPPMPSG